MERWAGRVAVVTGASAGIGAAITKDLLKNGMKVVGLARRVDRVKELTNEVPEATGTLYPVQCDITQEAEIQKAFEWIENNLGAVHVLINNAGLAAIATFEEGNSDSWRRVLDTNVLGLSLCTRYALKSMRSHNIDDGQFININSVAGHAPPPPEMPEFTMYFASKHAVTVLTEGLRREILNLKANIRVASLSPGTVKTEIPIASNWDYHIDAALLNGVPTLEPEDVSSAVIYVLSTPAKINIYELIIKPTGEAF